MKYNIKLLYKFSLAEIDQLTSHKIISSVEDAVSFCLINKFLFYVYAVISCFLIVCSFFLTESSSR